jgi:hypothetical protein
LEIGQISQAPELTLSPHFGLLGGSELVLFSSEGEGNCPGDQGSLAKVTEQKETRVKVRTQLSLCYPGKLLQHASLSFLISEMGTK